MDTIYIIYRVIDNEDGTYEHDVDFELEAFRDFEEAKKAALKEAEKCIDGDIIGEEFVCDPGLVGFCYRDEEDNVEFNVTPMALH